MNPAILKAHKEALERFTKLPNREQLVVLVKATQGEKAEVPNGRLLHLSPAEFSEYVDQTLPWCKE